MLVTGVQEHRSSRQVKALVVVQAIASLVSYVFVFAGTASDGMETRYQVLLGTLWAIVALFTYLGRRFLPFWFIDVSLLASVLLLSLSVTFTPSGVVQILDGVGLIGFGIFAAYQLSGGRLAVFLTVGTIAYLYAIRQHYVLKEPFVAGIVMIVFVASTVHVWYLVQRLRDAAVIDPLTGAFNRKGLFERAAAVRAVADRNSQPTAVVVIDLDRFKQFNDQFGHAAGDRLLAQLVAAWRNDLRPSDIVARIGGDEFVLVLPNCDDEQAAATLIRLRAVSDGDWTAGAVQWSGNGNILDAVDQADRVMYEAKQRRT